MPDARLIALAAFAVVAAVCGLTSSVLIIRMVSEVNAHLPPDQQFRSVWWHYGKLEHLLREYRRLCPAGSGARQFGGLLIVMTVSFIAAAIALFWH